MLHSHTNRGVYKSTGLPVDGDYSFNPYREFDWRHLLRHVRLILLAMTICLAVGLVYVSLRTPLYTATTQLLIDHKTVQFLRSDAMHSTSSLSEKLLLNQLAILRSEMIAKQVVERVNLENEGEPRRYVGFVPSTLSTMSGTVLARLDPYFGGRNPEVTSGQVESSAEAESATLRTFKSNLHVDVPGGDNTLTIAFTASDPNVAAIVANETAQVYLEDQRETNQRTAQTASGWLRERVAELGTSARVLTPARPPQNPIGLPNSIVIAAAVIGGFLCGIASAFVREIAGARIHSASDVRAATGAPYLAGMPRVAPLVESRAIKAEARGGSAYISLADAVRAVGCQRVVSQQARAFSWALDHPLSRFAHEVSRVGIVVADSIERGRGSCRAVGITSYGAKDGTTTITANVGQVLANRGLRVLLIDAVPHNRGLSRGFAIHKGPGLMEVLQDQVDLARTVWVDPKTGLNILPLSALSAKDALVGQIWCRAMERLVKGEQYDCIIVDLPPIGLAPDAVAAAGVLDGILLVMRRGIVPLDLLTIMLSSAGSLREKLVGVVINKIRHSRWQCFVDRQAQSRRECGGYLRETPEW